MLTTPSTLPNTLPELREALGHAVTHAGLAVSFQEAATPTFEEDLAFLSRIGARFVGRAAFMWQVPPDVETHFRQAEERARRAREAAPNMLLQACVFETSWEAMDAIPVPDWAFRALGRPPETRTFRYLDTLYPDGTLKDAWGRGGSVPDIRQAETKLWFTWLAGRYIRAGYPALHLGQIQLTGWEDKSMEHWGKTIGAIRSLAAEGPWGGVLLDAHVAHQNHLPIVDGHHLLDFWSFPLRPEESGPYPGAKLKLFHKDTLCRRSKPGVLPIGVRVERIPYLVELDNFGYSGKPGVDTGDFFIWGYDEVSWFARMSREQQGDWLRYAHGWLRANDPNGYLQVATRRLVTPAIDGNGVFDGKPLEPVVRALWMPG